MALSRTMFDLDPHAITTPQEAAKKLGQALVDTLGIETIHDYPVLSKLWVLLSAYKIKALDGDVFLIQLRKAFPKG